MCGIVGYIGNRNATPIILNGLKRLNTGVMIRQEWLLLIMIILKFAGMPGNSGTLKNLSTNQPIKGNMGIGHTRWATHGEPTARNAHPHLGATGNVVVVHNGIVENFIELKDELVSEGVTFSSETDTETIVHFD